jgi:hypothetical protein
MPLAEDQRAMLQLLLEGGQNYADIGSLLGVDAGEVRNRSRAALADMGGADPDAQVSLTDYLLGQADPIGRADAARHLQGDPAAAALAQRLSTQLRLIAPGAQLPELPAASASAPTPAPAPPPSIPLDPATPPNPPAIEPTGAAPVQSQPAAPAPPSPAVPSPIAQPAPAQPGAGARVTGGARSAVGALGAGVSGLAAKERRIPVALGFGAILILVVVLFVTGVFGGGDDDSDAPDTPAAAATSAGDVNTVSLVPPGGGDTPGGQAVFASAEDQPIVQLNMFGLEPSDNNSTYIVWFYNSDTEAVPFAFQSADKDGNITGAAAIPQALVPALPSLQQIRVTKTTADDAEQLVAATKKKGQLPPFVGTTVLEGDLPQAAAAPSGG